MANIVNQYGQVKVGVRVQSSGGGGIDADAQAFITAASITDSTQQSAINTLVTQLKGYGIWTKLKAVYPFVGGTASAHKFNLKDPRDLDAAYRLVFNGGWTHSSTGALPNGSNAAADTKLVPSSVLTNNNTHVSFYSRTQSTSLNGMDIGCYDFTTELGMTQYYNFHSSKIISMYEYPANAAYINNTNTLGFQIGSRISSTSLKLYFNNSLLNTNTTNNVKTQPTISLSIGASTRPVGFNQYSNRESAFASIGDGLTDAEAANFYTAVQTFQTTLGRHVGVPIVADTDAQAFLNAAVITNQTQASAINTLVTDLKSANIWTKMKAIYPFVGGTATSHKFNLKDPRDLDAAYRLVFNGGWTHSSTGALPNGTTAYADTKYSPYTIGQLNSAHMSYYSRTNISGNNAIDMGALSSAPGDYHHMHIRYTGDIMFGLINTNSAASLSNNSSQGLFLASRTSSTSISLFRSNTKLGSLSLNSAYRPNNNIYIGAGNISNAAQQYSTKESAFATIGDGLTDAEALAFYNAVQAYQTTLGRQV